MYRRDPYQFNRVQKLYRRGKISDSSGVRVLVSARWPAQTAPNCAQAPH
jgi:hypothetical protein